ncbi:acyl-CoA dehydrogenase family protein [Pseudonocardia lutea]|uniref:Acyl-CoA dehydrogenase family protein n=1 Tax=Pseudonocardia lutea TaxID=2172015 RepID=A0ABW1IA32_9PSEU
MDLTFSDEDEAFRREAADWLAANLTGRFAQARGLGGPGREHEAVELRREWERELGRAGWTCLGWPKEHGGRDATLPQQVIFHEEYVRAQAPTRVGHIGEGLIGPTLIALGTDAQKERFLPPIARGEELWCQGYSEPGAGSDLAGVSTRARLVDGRWHLDGQKVWTSLAHEADWAFVLARTEPGSKRHAGLSYLLVPMDQPGVTVRPIVQPTGTSEFNEVFFDDAVTDADCVVGEVGQGWRVAMATLAYERGASTLGQQLAFRHEFDHVLRRAAELGTTDDPVLRDRLVQSWVRLEIMRLNALRTMTSLGGGEPGPEVSIAKLYWSNWHRDFGELAMAALGEQALVAEGLPYELSLAQRLFLFSRADTIYAGSNEIQRTIIAERTLGLPRGPK